MSAALKINDFNNLDDAQCDARIVAAKQILGRKLVVLGHHYQRSEVYKHADLKGDSLRLAREAAKLDAEYIVFCGVHFMAEVADIVTEARRRSEEHTSELQSRRDLVCRLLLEKKKKIIKSY